MVSSPVIPWPALAVLDYLRADDRVTELFGDRLGTRSPADVGQLHAVVQAPALGDGLGARPRHGLTRPLLLLEARCAAGGDGDDPEELAMNGAGLLAAVFAEARNVTYGDSRWSVLSSSAAFALPVDETRGVPVFRGAVQGEVSLHARRSP